MPLNFEFVGAGNFLLDPEFFGWRWKNPRVCTTLHKLNFI
jgi:hypothetical protein